MSAKLTKAQRCVKCGRDLPPNEMHAKRLRQVAEKMQQYDVDCRGEAIAYMRLAAAHLDGLCCFCDPRDTVAGRAALAAEKARNV